MKKAYFLICIMVIIFFTNLIFTMPGCSVKSDEKTPDNISNSYANLPLDITELSQAQANQFSWLSFIAMNWPADITNCGPDTSNGNSILSGKGPVVWETYLSSEQVFVDSPAVPDSWCNTGNNSNFFKSLPKNVQQLANKEKIYRFIYRTSKSPHDLEEAVGGPLVDQNGRFTRYEVRINKDEYMYITNNSLWDSAGQGKFAQKASTVNFPAGPTPTYGPAGAMEFKAAWKILGKGDDFSKFYTIKAIVYNDDSEDPSPGPNPVTLGLVGLHIAHKTKTQLNWVWSTFEHVDNLTKSFYNKNCKNCPVNQPLPANLPGNNYKELDSNGVPLHAPTQVTRVNPIEDITVDSINKYYQSLLKGSVWANYQLISTQWLFFGDLTPDFLANSVQETYVQGPHPATYGKVPSRDGVNYFQFPEYKPFAPGISASCMGCHYAATLPNIPTVKADFSFLLGNAQ